MNLILNLAAKESGASEGVVGARVAEKRKATAAGDSATSTPTQSSKVQKKAFADDVKTSKSSKVRYKRGFPN